MARPRPRPYPSLSDLPDPLLEKLLAQVDDQSLVELSATCRKFNTKALTTFFGRHKMRDSPGLFPFNLPHISLKATRRAMFVHNLSTLRYSFPSTKKLFADAHDMTQLVERLTHVSHVTFYFTALVRSPWDADYGHRVDRVAWKEALSTLLDKVLDRGCENLYVVGGGEDWTPSLYCDSMEMQKGDTRQLIALTPATLPMAARLHSGLPIALGSIGVRLLSIFQKKSRKTPAAARLTTKPATVDGAGDAPVGTESMTQLGPASTSPSLSSVQGYGRTAGLGITKKIRDLNIHSEMLLDDPFLDWTIATIIASSSTLTALSFECPSVHTDVWHKVLDSLHLPHLQAFQFVASGTLGPPQPDLRYFLAANPTITTLTIHGLAIDGAPFTPLIAPILPNLVSVRGDPYCITWLLSNITIDRASMPHLTSITIGPGWFDFSLSDLDEAIVSVADIQRKVELRISFGLKFDGGIQSWLQDHIQNRHTTPFRLLDHIQDLVISPSFSASCDSDITVPVLHLLPEWLNLFPDLRSLRFEELPPKAVRRIDDLEYKQILADRCPKLERISASGWAQEFSLDELRGRNRAMEDGSGGSDTGLGWMDDPILDGSG